MCTQWRKKHAKRLLESPEGLEKEWKKSVDGVQKANTQSHMKHREHLKVIEAQTALIRLLQRESRLKQQILLTLGSFASGSLITWYVKRLVGS